MARTAPETINRLTLAQQYKLIQFVEIHYVESKQTDEAFALLAAKELNMSVTKGNINGCREALGLMSNRDVAREEAKKPKNRLEAIEQRLERLEALAEELGWKI